MVDADIPRIVETLNGYLAIEKSQREIFERKMMEFKADADQLRAVNIKLSTANKELRDIAEFYVKWGESQIKPCAWDVGRVHNRARAALGLEPRDLLSACAALSGKDDAQKSR